MFEFKTLVRRIGEIKLKIIGINQIVSNSVLKDSKNSSSQTNYQAIKFTQIPQMGLVSFGSKQSAISDLLKGAKEVCSTGVKKALLDWEAETANPSEARLDEIADSVAKLEVVIQEQTKSPLIKNSLTFLKEKGASGLDDFHKALVRVWSKSIDEATKIPPNFVEAKSKLTTYSSKAWAEARENNDFSSFEPYLANMFISTKKETQFINPEKKPLDTLLNYSGYTTEEVTQIFEKLKKELVPLAKQIISKSKVNQELLAKPVDLKQMQEFAIYMSKEMGLDMSRVRLGKVPHSFMAEIDSPKEIGIAITEREPNIGDSIKVLMSFLHESGHGLVELGSSPKLYRTGLTGATLDLHESQSRLWENMVGRSKEFWQHYYPKLQDKVDGFKSIKFDDFYQAMNLVQCSPVRIKADEVTYNLHIALRHEIENELLNPKNTDEDIKKLVSKLPETWNNKMEEYLGIRPKNDKEGVLQDVHWSEGLIGYFPSYGLGNLMSAQIMNTAKKEIPDLEQRIASGDLKTLSNWLKEKIYQHGQTYTSAEVMQRVTGEPLNPKYFIDYLKAKYL